MSDQRYDRTILAQKGHVIFRGACDIGHGCKLSIGNGATLDFGADFKTPGDTMILCKEGIKFGTGFLLSWDIQMMDTDFHSIIDKDGKPLNSPAPIEIGDHVWIGSRCTILIGVHINNGCVVAAGLVITKKLEKENTVYGGQGKNVCELKNDVSWHL